MKKASFNDEFKSLFEEVQEKKKYSTTKIAALLDVSVTTVYNWLNKTHEVKQIYLKELKRILLYE